ncbi:MAG: MFS transporter [Deltaproteobacteria bacterium]|nr:MFS transporter [Deltaproteobacteria bacterium]
MAPASRIAAGIRRNLAKIDVPLDRLLTPTDIVRDPRFACIGAFDQSNLSLDVTRNLVARELAALLASEEFDFTRLPLQYRLRSWGVRQVRRDSRIGRLLRRTAGFTEANFPNGPDGAIALLQQLQRWAGEMIERCLPAIDSALAETPQLSLREFSARPAIQRLLRESSRELRERYCASADDAIGRRVVLAIFLIVLADISGWAVILPLLPYYAEKWGATPRQVGALFSVYALAQIVASPLLGRLADRIGRKSVLLLSLAGSFLSFVWLGFAGSYTSILLSRALSGITAGNLPVAQASVADFTKASERTRAFGTLGVAYGLGFLLGPAISSALMRFGYFVPIMAAALVSAVSIVLTLALLPGTSPPRASEEPAVVPRATPRASDWRLPAALLGLFFVAFNLFTSGFGLFAERSYRPGGLPFGAQQLGWLYAYVGAVAIVVQATVFRHVLDRLGEAGTIAVGFAAAMLGFGALPLVSEWKGILTITTVAVFGVALLRPTLTGVLSRSVSSSQQGQALGLSQSLQGVAQLLAPMATGVLIGSGYLAGWSLAIAGCLAIGLVLNFTLEKNHA